MEYQCQSQGYVGRFVVVSNECVTPVLAVFRHDVGDIVTVVVQNCSYPLNCQQNGLEGCYFGIVDAMADEAQVNNC